MDTIFYTVRAINGDYAELVTDSGQEHSITMFLLPEGTTWGRGLTWEDSPGSLVNLKKSTDLLPQAGNFFRRAPPGRRYSFAVRNSEFVRNPGLLAGIFALCCKL